MKEFTESAGTWSILPGQQIFIFLAGYHAQGHDLNVFETFCDTIFTPKEWFLSKKGPKANFCIIKFMVCQSSYFVQISTMALNSSGIKTYLIHDFPPPPKGDFEKRQVFGDQYPVGLNVVHFWWQEGSKVFKICPYSKRGGDFPLSVAPPPPLNGYDFHPFFTPLFSFAIESYIYETGFTLGLIQKYHF